MLKEMQRQEVKFEEGERRCPSFRMESPIRISAAADLTNDSDNIDDGGGGFEFSFIQIPDPGHPITAADIFSNGKICPVYPLFNRNLLIDDDGDDTINGSSPDLTSTKKEEGQSSESKSIRLPLRRLFIEEEREQASSFSSNSSASSSSLDELDTIPPGTYCVWNPKAANNKERCKKSSSTGSMPSSSSSSSSSSLRWRLRDLVVGRSKSDGKEKFVFIPIKEEEEEAAKDHHGKEDGRNNNNNSSGKVGKTNKSSLKEKVPDVVTAQKKRMLMMGSYYGQSGLQEGAGRKSFLPYKQDLVGFFGGSGTNANNAKSSGRTLHPPF